jgi:hypothetical protein
MHGEDIRNNNPKSINNQEENTKSNTQDNGNSEPENISIDKNQGALSNEHTQQSQHTPFYKILRILSFRCNIFLEKEYQKEQYK